VDFLAVCPELALGLPVPRPPLHLVRTDAGIRLIHSGTLSDLTEEMTAFCRAFFARHPRVSAAILKERSPSCGIADAVVRTASGSIVSRAGSGLFAAACVAHLGPRHVVPSRQICSEAGRKRFVFLLRQAAAARR